MRTMLKKKWKLFLGILAVVGICGGVFGTGDARAHSQERTDSIYELMSALTLLDDIHIPKGVVAAHYDRTLKRIYEEIEENDGVYATVGFGNDLVNSYNRTESGFVAPTTAKALKENHQELKVYQVRIQPKKPMTSVISYWNGDKEVEQSRFSHTVVIFQDTRGYWFVVDQLVMATHKAVPLVEWKKFYDQDVVVTYTPKQIDFVQRAKRDECSGCKFFLEL